MRSNLFFIRVKDDFCLALSCLKSSIRSSISPLVASSPPSSATSPFTDMTAINLVLLPKMFTRMNCIQNCTQLLATNFTIWPNSNSQKNYQANSKTINRINENCLSVQVLPSSKLFWLIFFNTRVFNLGPCKFPSHFIQSGLEWVP